MDRYSKEPEKCPHCGACQDTHPDHTWQTCVDVTCYNRDYFEMRAVFDPEGVPYKQPVRLVCTSCYECVPLTSEFANEISSEVVTD